MDVCLLQSGESNQSYVKFRVFELYINFQRGREHRRVYRIMLTVTSSARIPLAIFNRITKTYMSFCSNSVSNWLCVYFPVCFIGTAADPVAGTSEDMVESRVRKFSIF